MIQPLYDALISVGVPHDLALKAAESVASRQTHQELIGEMQAMLEEMQAKLNQQKHRYKLDNDEGLSGVRTTKP